MLSTPSFPYKMIQYVWCYLPSSYFFSQQTFFLILSCLVFFILVVKIFYMSQKRCYKTGLNRSIPTHKKVHMSMKQKCNDAFDPGSVFYILHIVSGLWWFYNFIVQITRKNFILTWKNMFWHTWQHNVHNHNLRDPVQPHLPSTSTCTFLKDTR